MLNKKIGLQTGFQRKKRHDRNGLPDLGREGAVYPVERLPSSSAFSDFSIPARSFRNSSRTCSRADSALAETEKRGPSLSREPEAEALADLDRFGIASTLATASDGTTGFR